MLPCDKAVYYLIPRNVMAARTRGVEKCEFLEAEERRRPDRGNAARVPEKPAGRSASENANKHENEENGKGITLEKNTLSFSKCVRSRSQVKKLLQGQRQQMRTSQGEGVILVPALNSRSRSRAGRTARLCPSRRGLCLPASLRGGRSPLHGVGTRREAQPSAGQHVALANCQHPDLGLPASSTHL